MRKKKFDSDGYQGNGPEVLQTGRVVDKGFLPSPADLAAEEKTIKVTLTLTERSVNEFKKLAKKHNTKYQRMIRNLIDDYVSTL